tara:strand:- start:1860 stop:2369 length:510 start_codon:yes stop_codon:yes gene_type:complete
MNLAIIIFYANYTLEALVAGNLTFLINSVAYLVEQDAAGTGGKLPTAQVEFIFAPELSNIDHIRSLTCGVHFRGVISRLLEFCSAVYAMISDACLAKEDLWRYKSIVSGARHATVYRLLHAWVENAEELANRIMSELFKCIEPETSTRRLLCTSALYWQLKCQAYEAVF